MATLDALANPVQMAQPNRATRPFLKSELNRERLIGMLGGGQKGITALRPTASSSAGTTLLRSGGK